MGSTFALSFSGTELIKWFIDHNHAENVEQAARLGQALFGKGKLAHVQRDFHFMNERQVFYRFTCQEQDRGHPMKQSERGEPLAGSSTLTDLASP